MPAPAPPILEIYVLWHPDDDTRSCTAVSAYRVPARGSAAKRIRSRSLDPKRRRCSLARITHRQR